MITETDKPQRSELVIAERRYFGSITIKNIDVQKAINSNSQYYQSLFNLYQSTSDPEDKLELAQELSYLNQQLCVLNHTKLTQGGTA
jgi:hypothetical protein